jgi:hypothetical protein
LLEKRSFVAARRWRRRTRAAPISNASVTVTSASSVTLNFPIARGGDTSYDAFVQYQTQARIRASF